MSLDGVREDMQNLERDNDWQSCTRQPRKVDAGGRGGLGERIDALEELEQDGGDYLLKSGDVMSGVLDMDSNFIANVKPSQRQGCNQPSVCRKQLCLVLWQQHCRTQWR